MKRVIEVRLIVFATLCLGFLFGRDVAGAGGGPGVPAGNGDVNADAKIDITDPIYLLSSLFTGGPPPVPIECPPPVQMGLPATGQTKCYNVVGQDWLQVECDQATCKGQDGFYAIGCPPEGRFTDNGDGTVTDTCTGLMWQKDTADVNEDGKTGINDGIRWCPALVYCEALDFAGYDDWRLPNVRELQSIYDYGSLDPSKDPVFGVESSSYWSSTSVADNPNFAWRVSSDGLVYFQDKAHLLLVRAVRSVPSAAGGAAVAVGNGDVDGSGKIELTDAIYLLTLLFRGGPAPAPLCAPAATSDLPDTGQTRCYIAGGIPCDSVTCPGQDGAHATGCPLEDRFLDNGDGTVTDNCTGLMWQKDTADVNPLLAQDMVLWCDALSYCEDLILAGHEDWRLPNVRELESLVDYGRFDPSMDPTFGAEVAFYWSSTPIANNPDFAWIVKFDYGGTGYGDPGRRYLVRAVRPGR